NLSARRGEVHVPPQEQTDPASLSREQRLRASLQTLVQDYVAHAASELSRATPEVRETALRDLAKRANQPTDRSLISVRTLEKLERDYCLCVLRGEEREKAPEFGK